MGYSRAGGKLIHEKTRSKKSCDTVPLCNFPKTSGKGYTYFNDGKFKRKINIGRHGPRFISNIHQLLDPPYFSLPTTGTF